MGIVSSAFGLGEKLLLVIWKKAVSLWKYKIRWIWRKKKLIELSDKKYQLETDKIDEEILILEAKKKEQAGLNGLRYSSSLARELLSLNLDAVKRKINLRNDIDFSIIFQGKRLNGKNIVFLYERVKKTASLEVDSSKSKMRKIYQECHANSFTQTDETRFDETVNAQLKEIMTNMLIRKDTF